MRYMQHDWDDETLNRQQCKRCGVYRTIEEYNIPCGTSSRTWYSKREGGRWVHLEGYPYCVEKE